MYWSLSKVFYKSKWYLQFWKKPSCKDWQNWQLITGNQSWKWNHKTSAFSFRLQFSELMILLLAFSFSIIFSTFAFRFSFKTFHFFPKISEVGYTTQNEIFELSMQCSHEKEGKSDINKTFAFGFQLFRVFFTFPFCFSLSKMVSLFA